MKLNVINLGLIDYPAALDLQWRLLTLRQKDLINDVLLLLEHPPVITFGVNGKEANVLVDEEYLCHVGVNVHHTNRGGDVTYHGPGQIVGYPIINLNYHGKDVKDFFWRLEETFITLLNQEYKLKARRSSRNNGVWVGDDKITAIGCAAKRWVTMHGFAVNINTNLEHFKWINPCGITDRGVTSLEKLLGSSQCIETVMSQIVTYFSWLFDFEPELVKKDDLLALIEGCEK